MLMRQECRQRAMRRLLRRALPALVALMLFLLSLGGWLISPLASAAAMRALPPNASCAQLARVDPTATNGPRWGTTLMPGFGASGGWFGVPVCANSANQVAPGGANLSCDRVPTNFARTGCAPGSATRDGYGLSFQCVELVIRFSAWAFGAGAGWHGDAQYLWLSGHHPGSFTPYAQGGTRTPAPGDVLVWGTLDRHGNPWPAGPKGGHVAVVAAVNDGWITFVEENMLGRRGNIPEETTTLTERNGHWTVGPTYATSGGRALYGWLHAATNTGQFPSSGPAPASHAGSSARATAPSLEQGVVVTGAGEMAQLVWSDTHSPARPIHGSSDSTPHAAVESLGAPPGVTLAPGQKPAVVTLPTGERYSFARGEDGRLFAAYTTPDAPGALWQALGAPPGLTLTSGATALWDGDSVTVGALASDGAVWLRTGPAGMLDSWVSLGRPAANPLQGTPALVRAPKAPTGAEGTVAWVALAIGQDGALYEADGRALDASAATTTDSTTPTTDTTPSASSSPPRTSLSQSHAAGWDAWTAVAVSGLTSPLGGALVVAQESLKADGASTASGAVDALATDTSGHLWVLRRAAMDQPWDARAIPLPDTSATLLGAALTPAVRLQVYLADPKVSAGHSATQTDKVGILTGALSLSATSARAPTWSLLGFAPSATTDATAAGAMAVGAPVALGAGLRALLLARATQVALIGDQAALDLLAPGAHVTATPVSRTTSTTMPTTTLAPPGGGAGAVTLGTVAPPGDLSDALTGSSLDPRWAVSGVSPQSAWVADGALTLAATTSSGRVEVAQAAPWGDVTITAQVAPAASWRTGAKGHGQAGVLLALDDWNRLSLSLRADGRVALCPVVNGKALTCQTAAAPTTTRAGADVYLRLVQTITTSGAQETAAASADGESWSPVGSWRLSWFASAEAAPLGAYAPMVSADSVLETSGYYAAPLAFTRLGLFAQAGASTRFRSLTITSGA
jgi:CHAP domain-containing protein